MKRNYINILVLCLTLLLVVTFLNRKYEVIAVHPFYGDDKQALKVMAWNAHCSRGADIVKQRKIVGLILKEESDFLLLNEYNQDSCLVIDSLLKAVFPYTEECKSHKMCGDIFYSKYPLYNSGGVYKPRNEKGIPPIKATIVVRNDTVQIFGAHMAGNNYDEDDFDNCIKFKEGSSYSRYKAAQITRCHQVQWIKNEMIKSNHPIIVLGDMNDFNCSPPLNTLTSCGLRDSWWEGGNGYGCTFHDGWMRLRIDHILHSKELKLESIKVIETDLSDHNPIVAGFSIIKN